MPYKYEKLNYKIPREIDKRVKISNENKKEIIKLREKGLSYNNIAKKYDVSKTLIYWIVNPDLLKINISNKNWKNYYNKKKHAEYMRNYRRRKQELIKNNII